ncbi:MAG: lysophospholipid acyltransferase family protein [Eubacteriales bacterium]|nr:lysophospholipid acyltransferase family protein [Eubacteriales bacterium]
MSKVDNQDDSRRVKARDEHPEPVEKLPRAHFIYRSLLNITKPLFKLLFNLKIQEEPGLEKEHGPCLVLANHVSYLDVLPAAYAMKWRDINFVAGKELFYKPILGSLLRSLQAIPKEQFYPDPGSIGRILRILRNDGVCILFPEGQRSYTGAPLAFSPGAAKLIKKLKIQVYTIRIKGAGLAWPRWADQLRRGRIEVELASFMTKEEVQQHSLEEIQEKLSRAIYHNEYEWQEKSPKAHKYRSRKLAEGLERIIYYCPSCKSELGFRSQKKQIFCRSCGASYKLNADYSFNLDHASSPANPYLWTELQLKRMRAKLESAEPLYSGNLEYCTLNPESREPGPLQNGRLLLTEQSLELIPLEAGEKLELRSSSEGNTYVSLGNFVQLFGSDGTVYRLIPEHPAEVCKIVEALQVRAEAQAQSLN